MADQRCFVALAVGLIVVGKLGERAGMPAGWRWLSLVLATLSLVGVLLSFFDVYPLDALFVLAIAGVLAPAWALWLSGRASNLWPDSTVVSIPAA